VTTLPCLVECLNGSCFVSAATMQPYNKTNIWNGLKGPGVLEKLFNSTPAVIASTLTLLSRVMPEQSQLGDAAKTLSGQIKGAPMRLLKFTKDTKAKLRALQVIASLGSGP